MSLSSPSQRDNDASRHDRQPNRRLQDPHQRQQQQTLEFDWISNTALDSSNDRSPNDPEITIENGYPAVYSCQDDIVVEGEDTRTLQFQFDYEFTMKDPRESSLVEVFYQDLPVLEWGILLMVVQAVDLGPCNLQQQQRAIRKFATDTESDTDATTDTTSGRQSAFDTRVVSLASTRKDVVDPTVDACEYLSKDLPADMICLAMQGRMTAVYTGDDELAVQNYLLSNLEQEIDSQNVLVRQIKSIKFLGDRATYGLLADSDTVDDTATVTSESDSYAGLVTVMSLGGAFLLFAVAGLARRIRRQKSKEITKAVSAIPDIEQVATGSSQTSESYHSDREVPSRAFAVAAAANDTTADDEELAMDTFLDDDDVSDCASDVTALHPLDLKAQQQGPVVDVLPPLPPTQPTKLRSQTMKKRRRRKKRSKRKLTRTNSRENSKEMETISEADENSASDDDEGSYYSTDDDDSLDHRSRDPSPARSLTGSLGSSGSATGVPPSPIKEEPSAPKIRRLPPPWV